MSGSFHACGFGIRGDSEAWYNDTVRCSTIGTFAQQLLDNDYS